MFIVLSYMQVEALRWLDQQASAQVMAKEGDYVALKLPSTEVRLVRKECYATLGEVGNSEIRNTSLGKAGRRRSVSYTHLTLPTTSFV